MKVRKLSKLPKDILALIHKAASLCDKEGIKAFVVGGFVRDLYLGLANFDLDIVLENNAILAAQKLVKELGSNLVCHHRFGTATIRTYQHHKLDIATARKEIYDYPGALPHVTQSTILEDLRRRDFTINTLAFSINKNNFGDLLDYFGALKDLKEKKIRVLHELSFIDDPTRILRAVRFAARFKFTIEPKTLFLLKQALKAGYLESVQKQRIRDEIILLLKEKNLMVCVKKLDNLVEFKFIHPRIKINYKLLQAARGQINWFNANFPKKRALDLWLIYFIAIVDNISLEDTNHILRNFCFGRGETKRIRDYKVNITKLIKKLSQPSLKPSQVYRIVEPLAYELILMIKIKSCNKIVDKHILDFFNIYNGKRLSVNGKDITGLGVKPGPYFKDILKKTLYAKLDGKLSSSLDELEYLKNCARRYIKR